MLTMVRRSEPVMNARSPLTAMLRAPLSAVLACTEPASDGDDGSDTSTLVSRLLPYATTRMMLEAVGATARPDAPLSQPSAPLVVVEPRKLGLAGLAILITVSLLEVATLTYAKAPPGDSTMAHAPLR